MLDDNYTKKYPDIEELHHLLLVLKNNKDHIPVFVLKSKYKKGYNDLCDKIRCSASAYALDASLHGLKVHISYADREASGNDSHLSIRLPRCRNRCRYVTQ